MVYIYRPDLPRFSQILPRYSFHIHLSLDIPLNRLVIIFKTFPKFMSAWMEREYGIRIWLAHIKIVASVRMERGEIWPEIGQSRISTGNKLNPLIKNEKGDNGGGNIWRWFSKCVNRIKFDSVFVFCRRLCHSIMLNDKCPKQIQRDTESRCRTVPHCALQINYPKVVIIIRTFPLIFRLVFLFCIFFLPLSLSAFGSP